MSMKFCWSISDQNCYSLDYKVEPSSCFYEKVHQVKLKYGSNHLAKNWGKRWIGLHCCFVYCQTHLGLLMSLLLPVSPWRRCHGPCWKSKLIRPCRNPPFGGRATRDSRDACSTKGIRAESPPTFIWGKRRKNRKRCDLQTFKWKVRELYLRTGKVLAPYTYVPRDDSL